MNKFTYKELEMLIFGLEHIQSSPASQDMLLSRLPAGIEINKDGLTIDKTNPNLVSDHLGKLQVYKDIMRKELNTLMLKLYCLKDETLGLKVSEEIKSILGENNV